MLASRRTLLAGPIGLLAGACSPLELLGAVSPRDPGGKRVASAPYGTDPRQGLDVYAPTDGTAGAPVVVFFYGGSWKSGAKADYAFVGEALAARGFVVVVPDYRLYPAVRFPAFLEDGAQAVRWAEANGTRFGGNPRRIALVGHSAGAYNAAMLALDRRYLRAAGAEPERVRALAGLSGPYDFYPFDDPTAVEVFGEAPDKPATQPLTFARGGLAAFLATGDRDTTVKSRNTAALAARLREKGAAVTEQVYPGLDHVDTLLALSVLFRGKAPILDDLTEFLKAGTR